MNISAEAIRKALHFRHAAKSYNPNQKIPASDFQLILEAAQFSPSSYGFELWDIIVIQDKKILEAFLQAGTWGAKGTLLTASHFVVLTAKTGDELRASSQRIDHVLKDIKHMSDASARGMVDKYLDWQKNDFDLNSPELLHQWAARQAYIALGNMMTVAAMRGIDSQPIEGYNRQNITNILSNHALLNAETDLPVVMVSFGYRSTDQPEKTRRPLEEIVTWA